MNNPSRMIALAALLALAACDSNTPAPLEGAAMGGAFTLTGEDGKPVSSSSFDGKYRLIYFGYTYCPDICPTDMQKLMQGYKLFAKDDPKRAAELVPIFITLDPARDTAEVVRKWTDSFDPRLVGLTGSVAEIDAVARKYAVYFKRQQPNADGAYLVDHARMAVLYGRKGEPISLISQDKDAKTIAAELDHWVK